MPDQPRTRYVTLFRGPTRALLVCQDCGERIDVPSDVWVPNHKCKEGQ